MDGVLTDGSLLITEDSGWLRKMYVRDGYALQAAAKAGYPILVISGSEAPPVKERLQKLGIQTSYFGVNDKVILLKEWAKEKQLSLSDVLVMGDDIPDLGMMKLCGLVTAPADAIPEVKQIAHYISPFEGGRGCVRDVIEKVMKLQHKWTIDSSVTST